MTLPPYQSKGTPSGILNQMLGTNAQPIRLVPGGATVNTAIVNQIATRTLTIIAGGAITQWNISLPAVAHPDETELLIAAPGGAVTALAMTLTPLPQANAHAMIRRRASAAGIATKVGNHSFPATGITAYLKNGGTLEKAASMATCLDAHDAALRPPPRRDEPRRSGEDIGLRVEDG